MILRIASTAVIVGVAGGLAAAVASVAAQLMGVTVSPVVMAAAASGPIGVAAVLLSRRHFPDAR